jgi:hypothetical protein|tara:strand:- start:315 stop:560 length:246 start_codon:yes stop_codon:yes gene_type:complete
MNYTLNIEDKDGGQKYIIASNLRDDQHESYRVYSITEIDCGIEQSEIVILDHMISEIIVGLITIEKLTNKSNEKKEKEELK